MQKEEYLASLTREIQALNPSDSSALVSRFSDLFWQRTIAEDLELRSPLDDAGFCIDSWRLFQERKPDEVAIRLINPITARDGWRSAYTVVTVMAKNMPFTVDSILMSLSHDGIVTHFLNNVVYAVDRDADGAITDLSLATDHDNRELFVFAE